MVHAIGLAAILALTAPGAAPAQSADAPSPADFICMAFSAKADGGYINYYTPPFRAIHHPYLTADTPSLWGEYKAFIERTEPVRVISGACDRLTETRTAERINREIELLTTQRGETWRRVRFRPSAALTPNG